MDSKPPIYIGIPTRDGTGDLRSFLTLLQLGKALPFELRLAASEAGNIPKARNEVLSSIRAQSPEQEDSAQILWWDTDIGVRGDSVIALAAMIIYGFEHGYAMTANYRMNSGHSVLMKGNRTPGDGVHYTDEEIDALPDRACVGMTGFGLLYIPQMPLDYVFLADKIGEDVHWWWDHPDTPLYLDKNVRVSHRKSVWI